jgi:hypothetical integral membrane protein (TIGR02206 family)
MKEFFSYYPETGGFSMYGAAHLAWLAALACFVALYAAAYKNAGERRRSAMRLAIAIPIFAAEIIKDILACAGGWPSWDLLPLHLCGFSIMLICFHAIKPTAFSGECLYALSLPGALAALLFPNWTRQPLLNFFCIHSFWVHGMLIAFPAMLVAAGEIRPAFRGLWRPALFVAATAFPVYFVNKALDTNFYFINAASEGSPLVFLQEKMGNPGYLAGYAALLGCVWAVLYAPFALWGLIGRRRAEEA